MKQVNTADLLQKHGIGKAITNDYGKFGRLSFIVLDHCQVRQTVINRESLENKARQKEVKGKYMKAEGGHTVFCSCSGFLF